MTIIQVMNKDESGTAPGNKVTGEVVQVTKGIAQQLAHSIFLKTVFIFMKTPPIKQTRF